MKPSPGCAICIINPTHLRSAQWNHITRPHSPHPPPYFNYWTTPISQLANCKCPYKWRFDCVGPLAKQGVVAMVSDYLAMGSVVIVFKVESVTDQHVELGKKSLE